LTPHSIFDYVTIRIVMKALVSTASRATGRRSKAAAPNAPAEKTPERALRPVGRPRDPRLDATVLAATRRLLRKVGYARLTIGAIARDAGIHPPAIYRRWRSKAEIVHEAVYPEGDDSRRVEISGDVERDLRAYVRSTLALFTRPEVLAALPGLMADYRDDPDLQRKLVARAGPSARARFARMLSDAHARGDVAPTVSPDVLFDALSGTIIFRIMTGGLDSIGDLEDDLTGLLLAGAGVDARDRVVVRPARRRDARANASTSSRRR
jgi:AcrR family transcriptional regulator